MSRKIPRAAKDEAFKLWLGGCSYREIRDRTGMSLGAINQLIAEAKGRIPDIEELRELNAALMRGGSTVYDSMRGGLFLTELNRLGVDLDELEGFIKLSVRISTEKGVEAERFVSSTMRLMGLEAKTGKSCEDVVKDFEEGMKRIEGLEVKAKGVQGEIQRLMERKAQLEGEIHETKERQSVALQELNHVITIQERLQKLGLEKVSDLARFVEDFQLLGFDANTVRKLAEWRRSLAEMDIDPDKLAEFVEKKGPLEKQISELEKERRRVGSIVKKLRNEHRRLFEETASLQAEVSKLPRLGRVVKLGKVVIPCKICGSDGVFVKLRTAGEYRGMMSSRGVLQYRCFNCGQWSAYSPWEILTAVGLLVAPEQLKVQTPRA